MKIVFLQSSSTSYSFLDYNESEVDSSIPSNCSLYLFGRALITRNIELFNSMFGLETVFVPKKLKFISSIIKSTTDIPVEEIDENTYDKLIRSESRVSNKFEVSEKYNIENSNRHIQQNALVANKNMLFLPCNTVIGKRSTKKSIQYYKFQYPWEFLDIIQELLKNEVTFSLISNKATIAKSEPGRAGRDRPRLARDQAGQARARLDHRRAGGLARHGASHRPAHRGDSPAAHVGTDRARLPVGAERGGAVVGISKGARAVDAGRAAGRQRGAGGASRVGAALIATPRRACRTTGTSS
jgi:hypothetical protein